MSVDIIRAGVGDVGAIAPLFDSYRQFYRQEADLEGARQFLTDRLRAEESVVFLATRDATPVGFVQLYPSFSSGKMRPIWILNDLFVAPQERRGGVARRLMEAACDLARTTGAARLVLATAKDNVPARSLYLSLGYRVDEVFDHLELPLG